MECHEVQESILDALDRGSSFEAQGATAAHLRACPACKRFARVQQSLDVRLATTLLPPLMAPVAGPALRARWRRDALVARRDTLPDLVHFASFGVATLGLAWILPINAAIVGGGGATVALLSYVLLSAVRGAFEDDASDARA
jgi:hypothetical protein